MPHITIDQELCKGCKLCIEVCPKQLIYVAKNYNSRGYNYMEHISSNICTGCSLCAYMCPDSAITVYREDGEKEV